MREHEVASVLRLAGYTVHFHDGVWWQQTAPLFWKPVDPMRRIVPGTARPSVWAGTLGYSHLVADGMPGSSVWTVMLLDEEGLESFSMKSLKRGRRNTVRKALKSTTVHRIDDLEAVLDDVQDANITQAHRTGHGKPPRYYVEEYDTWRGFMLREFSIPGREWWGVFHDGRLIAYYYAYLIEGTMYISAAKSHSDYLKLLPNDGLLFSFLEYCRDLPACKRIVYGDWSPDAESLNKFKGNYGFQRRDLPRYVSASGLVKVAKRALSLIRRGR